VGVGHVGGSPRYLPAAVVPRREAALVPLEARGLVRRAWHRWLLYGLRAEGRAARRLPADHEPVDSPILEMATVAGGFVVVGSFVASAISLIVRARHASSEQRQQIKWIAYGGAVVVGAMLVGGLVSIWSVTVSIGIISVALLGLPLFTGIAIVRHRLYDIDLVINRTLVYGSLTVLLALLYFGIVTATQAIIQALTGQERQAAARHSGIDPRDSSPVQPPA
jgi:hypothetical protein